MEAHSSAERYAPIHDVILFYSRGEDFVWTEPRLGYEQSYLDKYYKYDDGDGRLYWRDNLCAAGVRHGSSGKPWRGVDPSEKGMRWKFTIERLDELDKEGRIYWPPRGTMPQYKRHRDELKGRATPDIWDDIDRINPVGAERLGYPTQKPEALLERIINASSRKGDTVLDPFGGCGTTVAAAQKLGRRWICIDITHLAITLMKKRLFDTFGKDVQFRVIGEPTDAAGAEALAKQDPYQFQWWALGLVEARPAEGKKGADKGIDGRIYFHDEADNGETKQVILSVKAGHTGVQHVRDLIGVLQQQNAAIGVLISLQEPTGPMRSDAAEAGFYHSPGWNQDYPRIQLRTIAELLAGKGIDVPPQHVTFKQAPKFAKDGSVQLEFTPVTSDAAPEVETPVVADKPRKRKGK